MSRLAAISELMSEIRQCENTILHCEGRILQKRAAIHELFQGAEYPAGATLTAPLSPVIEAAPTHRTVVADGISIQVGRKGISVLKMIEEQLQGINGAVFHYAELRTRCIAKYPADKRKIQTGVYLACNRLLEQGRIVRVPGGFQVNRTEQSRR